MTPSLRKLLPYLWIILWSFLVFFSALSNQYALDDVHIVRNNPLTKAEASIKDVFTSPYWNPQQYPERGLYRPLTILSFKLTQTYFEDSVFWDHFANIFLHGVVGLLLYLLLLRWGGGVPFSVFIASLYVAHPVQVESVASLVGRADILATLFALLSLLFLLRPKIGPWIWLLGIGAFFLSLLSKESAVALPAIFLLLAWKLELKKRSLWGTSFLFLALFAYLLLRFSVLDLVSVSEAGRAIQGGFIEGRWKALAFFSFFLQKIFIPIPLVPDYATGFFEIGATEFHFRAIFSTVFLLFVFCVYFFFYRRKGTAPKWAFGLVLFVLAALPVSNLVIVIGAKFAERFLYFPLVFLCLSALDLQPKKLASSPMVLKTLKASYGLLLFLCLGISNVHANVWRNNGTLFSAAVRDAPTNVLMNIYYGTYLLERHEDELAEKHFQRAIALDPNRYKPYLGLGILAAVRKDHEQAERYYLQALKLAPAGAKNVIQHNLKTISEKRKEKN